MAIPLQSGDEGYEFRGDRPPDYHSGDFAVWDPASQRPQEAQNSMMSKHTVLEKAFDEWIKGTYPQARNLGEVLDMMNDTYKPGNVPSPQVWPPKGAKLVSDIDDKGYTE